MSIVPEIVHDVRVYVNGSTDLKGSADIQLPSFENMTETINGAGLMGEYEAGIYAQFQSMKFTVNWRMITEELIEFLKPEELLIDCRVANQEFDSTNRKQQFIVNRVVVKGRALKNDLGKAEKATGYDGSSEIEVLYIKIERKGKTFIELDKINSIYIVDGIDYMADLRKQLGL